MAQAFEVLLIMSLICSVLTSRSTDKLFVTPHDVSFLKTKDWLNYIDEDENYTYGQAAETCLRLKLTSPVLYFLSIRTALPPKGEFWIPFQKPMMALNGIHKLVTETDDLTQRKGIICQAPLDGALVVYRNGTMLNVNGTVAFIPSYCYPQADLSEDDLDGLQLAMCLLIHHPAVNKPV